jgi:hypothetical protein
MKISGAIWELVYFDNIFEITFVLLSPSIQAIDNTLFARFIEGKEPISNSKSLAMGY